MNIMLFIFTLILNSFDANSNVCDSCVCRLKNKIDEDVHGEDVDCSYNPDILTSNYTLPTTVFSIDLSRNNLTHIKPSSLLRSATMVELYLNNNDLIEVDTNAFVLPELKRLDLSDNSLEFLHENTFANVKNLESLNLANNKFATFTALTFHRLSKLEELILDNNKVGPSLREINIFDRNGYGLTNKIKNLSLSGVGLNEVPENFFVAAYDIRKIIISNNNITEIFELPFTLQYLDLSDNPIKEISIEDFAESLVLKELKLNNLEIREVPAYVFSTLHSLTNLELERNKKLTNFSSLAFGDAVLEDADDFLLESLSIRGSRITTLDEKLLEPFGMLIQLDLQGNPWNCDCNLVWMKKLQISPNDYDHLRCATPRSIFNGRVFELDAKYFVCPITVSRHYVGVAVAAVSFCVVLATIAMWLFLFLPRYQSRCHFVQNMYVPSTAYSVLPVTAANDPF